MHLILDTSGGRSRIRAVSTQEYMELKAARAAQAAPAEATVEAPVAAATAPEHVVRTVLGL